MTEDLNLRLLAYLRKAAERRPTSRRTGPFVVTFDEADDNPFLNYAIPDARAKPSPADIAALIALFEARGRKPRLEYPAAAAPDLEAALLAQGFVAERRLPVLLHPAERSVVPPPPLSGMEVFMPSDDADLIGAEQAQAEAYGSPSRGPAGLRRTLRHGGVVGAARDSASGAIVGAGIAMVPVDGISEIAGIGVRSAFRRRGIAQALTARIAREAFAKGIGLLWLTPENESAARIYARAGFEEATQALHISR